MPINPRADQISTYMDIDRLTELWLAIKAALGQKADASELAKYATPEAVATDIAQALTEYSKTSEVTTAIATALSDYMTTTQVNDAIARAIADAHHITFQPVDTLPATGTENVIYLVPAEGADEDNVKTEYMWINGKWEILGDTKMDLSGYWSKAELRPITSEELQAIINPATEPEQGGGGEDNPATPTE